MRHPFASIAIPVYHMMQVSPTVHLGLLQCNMRNPFGSIAISVYHMQMSLTVHLLQLEDYHW